MWVDPWGWACISQNGTVGRGREKRVQRLLERIFGKDRVLRERYLRNSSGKSVRDPMTGERRRIDFLVQNRHGTWTPVEVTGRNVNKVSQITKEERIREIGGIYARNRRTGDLIEVDGISRIIRVK